MDQLDAIYQNAVENEIDRLARFSPCELMQLKSDSWSVDTEQGTIQLVCSIHEDGDVRQIAVVAERPVVLGFARRTYAGALRIKLSCKRLSSDEVAELYG